MDLQLYTLNRNPVLEVLVIPLNQAERDEMLGNAKRQDGSTGVRVWNTTILVAYASYAYCHRCNIPFSLINIPIRSEAEAVI